MLNVLKVIIRTNWRGSKVYFKPISGQCFHSKPHKTLEHYGGLEVP